MRLISGSRPAVLLSALLGALLALTVLPGLAGPARAATVVVSGKVTGLNATGSTVAVQDVFVEALDANGDTFDGRIYAYTATDGTYSLTLPATGTYQISMECWGDYPCADEYAPEPNVTTSVTAATTLNATLERWGRITGTVKKNGVATAWPNANITAANDARSYWSNWPGASVNADGTFTIDKVAPGTVAVTGEESTGGENLLTTVPGQTFTVTPGQTSAISLAVEDWKGFYVRAVDPDGAPLDQVRWNVFSRPVGGAWDNGLQYGPLETGADGRMSHRITDAREYTVCFYDDVYDDSFDPGPQRPDRYGTRCLGGSSDLAGATAWKPTAAQPKLKQDIVMTAVGKSMQPGHPWTTGTGVAAVGTPITVDPGAWSPAETTLSWQWKYWNGSGWTAIAGATSPSYTPTADLAGKRPVAFITGTAPGYATVTEAWSGGTVGGKAPTMTGSLSITGTLAVGSTATVTTGTFTPATTDKSWYWFLDGKPVFGAQGETITITEAMKGKRLEARLTAYDWSYGDNQYYNRVSVTVPGAISGSTPTITGTTTVGSTLTASTGTWTTGTTLSYQWLRAGAPIAGATAKTYPLVAADRGTAISVAVTGRLSGYPDVTKTSAATAPIKGVFTTVATPTITGTAAVGSTLTANPGTWSPSGATFGYQWYRSGTAISGATASTYKLTATDQAKTITVKVTGALTGYESRSTTSAATAAVQGVFTAPTPTISGTKAVGYTLTANVGTWSPAATTYTYQWYRSGAAISGATAKTYKLTSTDAGKAITVKVTGVKTGYVTKAVTSAATSAVLKVFSSAPVPTISGTRKVGYTLTANLGTWSPTPTGTTYKWYRSGVLISGATARTYKLTSLDRGKTIKVVVTRSLAGYLTTARTSASTASIV